MPSTDISDRELKRRCVSAILKGWSKTKFYMVLKAERRKVGQTRIDRIWKAQGGPLQARGR